jgi:hydroxycarboxylate dehydrogenase B
MSEPSRLNFRSVPADLLARFATDLLEHAGARSDDAAAVAQHLVTANLMGHDSHGVGMLPAYVRHIQAGLVNVQATPRLTRDTGAILQVDADGGWGVSSGRFAMAAGSARARELGLAMVTIAHSHHLGRIGAFAELAANDGLVSLHFVNVVDHAPLVAPFGGAEARLGTNPVCIAFPATHSRPVFLLDMATSWIALGKARVAASRGERVPFGAILDKDGHPTDDPAGIAGFEVEGALTPMGAHKGYALGLAAELLAGVLSGAGTIQPDNRRRGGIQNSMTSILISPNHLADPDWMEREVSRMCDYACAARPAEPGGRILVPGDPERLSAELRNEGGIPLDPETLLQLKDTARSLGCCAEL